MNDVTMSDAARSTMRLTTGELVDRITSRVRAASGRTIIGIVGAPGAGKSTLAAALEQELNAAEPGVAVAVPLDGYHLAASMIAGDDRADRRGAPDTFDPAGYASLMERVRADGEQAIYAPMFSRDIEDPVAAGILVAAQHRVVVTEGNYLLCEGADWERARRTMDEVWFLDLDPAVRHERLLARHLRFGKTPERAEAFTFGSDERNAALIEATRDRADLAFVWSD